MSKSKALIDRISSDLGMINLLLQDYDELLEVAKHEKPDLIKTTALASILHSFYTGIEAVLLRIAHVNGQ